MATVYSYTTVCLTIVRRGGRISFIGCASGIEDRLCDGAMMCIIWKLLLVWLLFLALGDCGNQDLLHFKRMQPPVFDGTRIMG